MTRNKIYIIISFLFVFVSAQAQEVKQVLEQIRQNSPAIKAASQLRESKDLQLKVNLLPESPELEYGHFSGSGSATGVKKTYGISQRFRFPTAYARESKLNKQLRSMSALELTIFVQDELFKAHLLLIELDFLLKKKEVFAKRAQFIERLNADFKKRYESGAANILELNKVKWQSLDLATKRSQLEIAIANTQNELQALNGGQALSIEKPVLSRQDFLSWEAYYTEYKANSSEYVLNEEAKIASQKELALLKANAMPNLSLGFEMESAGSEEASGVRAGISIPIWGTGKKLKSGKLRYESQQNMLNAQQIIIESEAKKQFTTYLNAKQSYELYAEQQGEQNSVELLNKAFKAGQLSFVEFFMELSYYFDLDENIIELEKDLNVGYARLTKYKL